MKFFSYLIALIIALAIIGGSENLAHAQSSQYTVHPPLLSVPDGEAGEIRRSIMQFEGWTLICDENRSQKNVICNVTQSIHDNQDNVVFSWSLAASENGRPFLLLRALPTADKSLPIKLSFDNSKQIIDVKFIDCDQNVCLAQSPVGPVLSDAINKESVALISYKTKDGQNITFKAPFKGLKEAVASIK